MEENNKSNLEENIKVLGNVVYFLTKGRFDLNMDEARELGKCVELVNGTIASMKALLDSQKEAPLDVEPK